MGKSDEEFSALYSEQRESLVRLAYLVCHDQDLAEEAVAEAVVRVLPRWRTGRIDDLDVYLRRSVVNWLISRFRRAAIVRRASQDAGDDRGQIGVEDRISDQDRVWRALTRLSMSQRAAIVLRHYEDLTEREAAEWLGVSVGTLKTRIHRGFARVREQLAEDLHG